MKSLLVFFSDSCQPAAHMIDCLNAIGMDVISVYEAEDLTVKTYEPDGIILCCTEQRLNVWLDVLARQFELPVWWWCQSSGFITGPAHHIEGILTSSMSPPELQWALVVGLNNYENRRSVQRQIEQLQEKLDERKLIERAKGILVKTTGMSEDEAFKYLRNKAMKERKKMAAISSTIVDLYGPLMER